MSVVRALKRSFGTALLTVPLLLSCTAVSGPTDQAFLNRVRSIRDKTSISVSSSGGDPVFAHLAALEFQSRDLGLRVTDLCLSSCAEFLIPYANRVSLSSTALVGFHGSDFIAQWIRSRYYPERPEICGVQRLSDTRAAYRRNGLNDEFWVEVATRMRIAENTISVPNECSEVTAYSEITMWFPTAAQLRDKLGLDVASGVCADNEDCWKAKVRRVIAPEQSFMVGDNIYTMQAGGVIIDQPNFQSSRQILVPSPRPH